MYARLLTPPRRKSFFLFGPRGTGKTTWVKATFPDAVYVDLLESEVFNDLTANPQRLGRLIPPHHQDWVVLDEVQRIPDLLHEVHRLIEAKRYAFILTGSSPRKLRRHGPNLLAGRALMLAMHPLSVAEVGKDFRLEQALAYGQLPSVYQEPDPHKYLEAYVKTYLEEEIRQEGLTRNLSAFARFLEAASFSQGSLVNISSVARECAVERKVVEQYFSILEDLLIAFRVPVFARRAKRRLVAHPKFYFFDVGVYRTLRPMGPVDAPEEVEGVALESLVIQELIALNSALDLGYRIYYWRDAHGLEVDMVLYGPGGLWAFEITRTARVTRPMLSGLQAFLEDYPMAKAYLLYGGDRPRYEGRITLLPVVKALKELPALLRPPSPVRPPA
jgi:predicted AAA+ superfamily ATPase